MKLTSISMAALVSLVVLTLLVSEGSATSLRAHSRLHLASRENQLVASSLEMIKKNSHKRGLFRAELAADKHDTCTVYFNLTYSGDEDVSVLTLGTPLADVPGAAVFFGTNRCVYGGALVEYEESRIRFISANTISLSPKSPSAVKKINICELMSFPKANKYRVFARFNLQYAPSGESPEMDSAGVKRATLKSNAVVLKVHRASEPRYERLEVEVGVGSYWYSGCDENQQMVIVTALNLAISAAKYASEQVTATKNKIWEEFFGEEFNPVEAGLSEEYISQLVDSPSWSDFEWNIKPSLCVYDTNGKRKEKPCPRERTFAWEYLSYAAGFITEDGPAGTVKVDWNSIVRTKQDVSQIFQNMASVLNETLTMNCKCPDGAESAFAFVYPTQIENKVINLCDAFWNAPAEYGEDSQPGTILHELSHFKDVGGTADFAYGVPAAKHLANLYPILSRWNADNFEFFAEKSEMVK